MIDARATDLSEAPALPRLRAAHSRALNRLYGHAAEIAVVTAALAGKLRFRFFSRLPDGIEPWCWHRFQIGQHTGALAIDSLGISSLLRESNVAVLPTELRMLLVADALHAMVPVIEKGLHARFEWLPMDDERAPFEPPSYQDVLGFELRTADGASFLGVVAFEDMSALMPLLPTNGHVAEQARLDSVRLPLRFDIGSTQLSVQALRKIECGDVISIDRWAASGTAVQVLGRVGGRNGTCLAGLAVDSQITLTALGESLMTHDESGHAAFTADAHASLPVNSIDALEVVLRFEVGELSVSLGELKSLRPGHVFELREALNRSTVRILTHGNLLGTGYLVAIGDHLGVRVAEFAPSPL